MTELVGGAEGDAAAVVPGSKAQVGAAIAVAVVAGLLLAVFWQFEFVDKVIGQGVAKALLGRDASAGAGWVGSVVMAVVTGLAGTFTACNVACFASLGPLAAERRTGPTRVELVRRAGAQLVWLAVGMMVVAAVYGAAAVLLARHLPMLSDGSIGPVPARLAQASVINVVLGIGLVVVAARYLSGRGLPAGRRGPLVLGGLLGLLVVGRPYPMFREVLADAARSGNILQGSLLMVLVVLGNIALLSVLFLGLVALAGPALQQVTERRPRLILTVGGAVLLALAVFSIAYWGLRVPSMSGIGWFPTV